MKKRACSWKPLTASVNLAGRSFKSIESSVANPSSAKSDLEPEGALASRGMATRLIVRFTLLSVIEDRYRDDQVSVTTKGETF